eukprot:10249891-Ditylum_brightwellii.AAC.1
MADRRTVEDLSKVNKELAEANKQLTSQMEKINDKLEVMTRLIKAIPTTRYNYGGGNNYRGRNNQGGDRNTSQWQRFVPDPHGYFWSCGYNVDKRHNSVTCNKKKGGHQEAATRSNPMGGSQLGKPQS